MTKNLNICKQDPPSAQLLQDSVISSLDFHVAASWQQYVVGLEADSRYNLPIVCNVFC